MCAGAPFVWTNHWPHDAVRFKDEVGDGSQAPDVFPSSIEAFESMPGRKLKLRCKACGTPIGSYQLINRRWTIWPTLLERDEMGQIIGGEELKPTAHQFYDTAVVRIRGDGVSKWDGYAGKSRELDDEGRPLSGA